VIWDPTSTKEREAWRESRVCVSRCVFCSVNVGVVQPWGWYDPLHSVPSFQGITVHTHTYCNDDQILAVCGRKRHRQQPLNVRSPHKTLGLKTAPLETYQIVGRGLFMCWIHSQWHRPVSYSSVICKRGDSMRWGTLDGGTVHEVSVRLGFG
jgi:hypothetical protein